MFAERGVPRIVFLEDFVCVDISQSGERQQEGRLPRSINSHIVRIDDEEIEDF